MIKMLLWNLNTIQNKPNNIKTNQKAMLSVFLHLSYKATCSSTSPATAGVGPVALDTLGVIDEG